MVNNNENQTEIVGFFYLLKQKGAIKEYNANNEEVFKLDKDKYNDFDDFCDQVFAYIQCSKKYIYNNLKRLGLRWEIDALPIAISLKEYEEYYLPYIPPYVLNQLTVENFFIKLYDYYRAPKGSKPRENLLKDLVKFPYEIRLSRAHAEHYIET